LGKEVTYVRGGTDFSILFLTSTPEQWKGLVAKGRARGVDFVMKQPDIDDMGQSKPQDAVVLDWSEGLPQHCATALNDFFDRGGDGKPRMAVMYRPAHGDYCQLAERLDDFVLPPYDDDELLMRISRLVSRTGPPEKTTMEIGDLRIDLKAHRVTAGDEEIGLTHSEFRLLVYLAQAQGRVVRRQELRRLLWGDGLDDVGMSALDVHVRRLRTKLREHDADFLETIRQVGFRVVDAAAVEAACRGPETVAAGRGWWEQE
jgi:two-component system OmpR family response regulator